MDSQRPPHRSVPREPVRVHLRIKVVATRASNELDKCPRRASPQVDEVLAIVSDLLLHGRMSCHLVLVRHNVLVALSLNTAGQHACAGGNGADRGCEATVNEASRAELCERSTTSRLLCTDSHVQNFSTSCKAAVAMPLRKALEARERHIAHLKVVPMKIVDCKVCRLAAQS
eukprot:6173763-Pleurochrysis_carterae.AAC.1